MGAIFKAIRSYSNITFASITGLVGGAHGSIAEAPHGCSDKLSVALR